MADVVANLVDVYPYRGSAADREYLLLRRRPGVIYSGDWRMVGGKILDSETAWQAAGRELEEETGCKPLVMWAIPSANVFFEWEKDTVRVIPAFAAEIDRDPVLNHEHDAFGWYDYEAACQLLCWPEQRRLLGIVHEELDRDIPVSWRVG